jgi:hypothetical protein
MSLFLAVLAAAMPQSTIIFRPFVAMETRQVTLGTVADLSRLPKPLRTKARQIMLFQIPDGERYVRLPLIQIASRARSLLPALIPWLPRAPTGDVILARSVKSSVRMVAAASAQGSIEAGSPINVSVYSGVFRIDLGAIAMQKGQKGGYFFAKSSTGKLLRVECCGQ